MSYDNLAATNDPAHEIITNLWIGEYPLQAELESFDVIVNVSDQACIYVPLETQSYYHLKLIDGLTEEATIEYLPTDEELEQLVANIISYLKCDQRVLVHCIAGINRSSFIVGLVMLKLGYESDEVIRLIRTKRSKDCLSNTYFYRTIKQNATTIPT